jgi:hypothetical protein
MALESRTISIFGGIFDKEPGSVKIKNKKLSTCHLNVFLKKGVNATCSLCKILASMKLTTISISTCYRLFVKKIIKVFAMTLDDETKERRTIKIRKEDYEY